MPANITYKSDSTGTKVMLEGKHVGTIRDVQATPDSLPGYRYQPKGSKNFGEKFLTMAEVKASIEGDSE